MATLTKNKVYVVGDRKRVEFSLAFDNSYPTGGESVSAADLGLELELNQVSINQPLTGNRIAVWDSSNKKILLFTALGTQATNASDQSTITVTGTATGKGSAIA